MSDEMKRDHRLNISRGKGQDPFRRACHKAGMTQNQLAKRLGITRARLSQYRRTDPIPAGRAAEIKRLTGWPDDAAHWPQGIRGE